MLSAFGVEHTGISKAAPEKIPDWASGAIPASSARAYNQSSKNKGKAAGKNFLWSTGGTAVGTLAGAAVTGMAFKKAKPMRFMPKTFYKPSKKVLIPFSGGKRTTIGSGEKQRWLGMSIGAPLGAAGGGFAGAAHLHQLKKDPKYGFKEEEK